MENTVYNKQSFLWQKIQKQIQDNKPIRFAFLDIDFTLSSQTSVLHKLMLLLKDLGYIVGFVTARTAEMLMDTDSYLKSKDMGFDRPMANIYKHGNTFVYKDPKYVYPFLINPDIILAATGTEILVKQMDGGYKKDILYQQRVIRDWRTIVLELLQQISHDSLFTLASIEYEDNYYKGTTDVFPTQYRIQINFASLEKKIEFLKKIYTIHTEKSFFHTIDDSDPQYGKYSLYLTPINMDKGYAVDHVLSHIKQDIQHYEETEVLLAGDSYPDIAMLLHSAYGTNATSLIVGGARITPIFVDLHYTFYVGENLKNIQQNLRQGKEVGEYYYKNMTRNAERRIIVGDMMYPKTIGPETLLEYLLK